MEEPVKQTLEDINDLGELVKMLKSEKIGRGKKQRIQKKIDRIKRGDIKEDIGETGATSDLNPKKDKKTAREKVEKMLNKRDEKINQKA